LLKNIEICPSAVCMQNHQYDHMLQLPTQTQTPHSHHFAKIALTVCFLHMPSMATWQLVSGTTRLTFVGRSESATLSEILRRVVVFVTSGTTSLPVWSKKSVGVLFSSLS
jgi:hypothetical protein